MVSFFSNVFGRSSVKLRRSLLWSLMIGFWCISLGWGIAHAMPVRHRLLLAQATPTPAVTTPTAPASGPPATTQPSIGTVDPVPANLLVGQQLYLQNCATCHVGVPPAVLPSQTWVRLLQTPEHYTVQIQPLVEPDLLLVWNYVRTFSRPFPRRETLPFRLRESRFFRALHPRVELPRPTTLTSCVTCHPGAAQYNYRTLSLEWENAP